MKEERLRLERAAGGKRGGAGPASEAGERGWGPASMKREERLRPERAAGGEGAGEREALGGGPKRTKG